MKEAHRDQRSARSVEALVRDVRTGLRAIRRTPVFSASALLILALGIAANTTMFSATQAILLQPLPYEDADELVVVLHEGRFPVAPANFFDWREQTTSFAAMGAAEYWTPNLGMDDRAERVLGLRVTADTLAQLGVAPQLGRLIEPADEASGRHRGVVIGHALWQRAFGGDPGAVGRTMRLDGEPYTILGVMPRGFAFAPFWAVGAELWAPLPLADRRASRGGNSLRLFARLKPGVTVARAQADIDAVTARLEREFPGTNRNVVVMALKERVVGGTRLALVVFLVAVGFVLLIACANVAHMLLARAAARQREVAVRLALGATHWQLVRQFLVESLLLAGLGGAAGVALAAGGIRLLAALAPADLPRVDEIAIDGRVLAFTAFVSVLTGLVFGLVPAWQTARPAMGEHLKGGRGTTGHRRQSRLRDLLVASELALALMLLVGAGLMVRSLAALQAIDAGFDPRGVLSLEVSVKGSAHADPALRPAFFTELVDRLQQLPGVTQAGAINHVPLAGDVWGFGFHVEGRPQPRPGERHTAAYRVVLPGYFGSVRLPLVRGRDFTRRDDRTSPGVVVVNEHIARTYWPGTDPIGKRLTLDRLDGAEPPVWLTVVGVVRDAVREAWDAPPASEIYVPYLQERQYLEDPAAHFAYMTMVLRTDGDPAALASAARQAVWAIDRSASVSEVTTMEAAVDRALARPRFQLVLLGLFAAVALLLAAAGIYGVMSYGVARRTQEIGLRLTLGAQRADVIRQVLGQAMVRVAVGGAAGVAGALALTHLMANLLHGVRPTDPLTFLAVSMVLTGAALLASYLPARRASRIDPVVALRQE